MEAKPSSGNPIHLNIFLKLRVPIGSGLALEFGRMPDNTGGSGGLIAAINPGYTSGRAETVLKP